MSKRLPPFQKMWKHYPNEKDAEKVKEMIGGKVDYPWIKNTCTIRLSRAFNYAGQPIKRGYEGISAVSGEDDKWYAFRVREMEKYLRKMYGEPDVEVTNEEPNKLLDAVADKKGIIQFKVRGWSDATGHLDIWDGSRARLSSYFKQSFAVSLWRCP